MTAMLRQRGQNLVELALVAPLLIALSIGIADLGRAFYTTIVLENAAREAVRYRASYPDEIAEAEGYGEDEADDLGVAASVTFLPDDDDCLYPTICAVATSDLDLVAGGFIGLGTLTLSRQADMVVLTGSE